eukprot:11191846-Lingulodinium_polyedra.AAC.1
MHFVKVGWSGVALVFMGGPISYGRSARLESVAAAPESRQGANGHAVLQWTAATPRPDGPN